MHRKVGIILIDEDTVQKKKWMPDFSEHLPCTFFVCPHCILDRHFYAISGSMDKLMEI